MRCENHAPKGVAYPLPAYSNRRVMELVMYRASGASASARLGCERGTLSRLLNGKAGVSANMALALEDIGWGTAEHWMRMQASYELSLARHDRNATTRRASAMHA